MADTRPEPIASSDDDRASDSPEQAREAQRLAALDLYDILDTPSETGFDDIVRIASQICGTPMALISLVDDRRQWFKAAVGISAPETSRDIAFCAHAIEQQDVFTVADTHADTRFAENPLVTGDLDLRFYAGAPLMTPDGLALGTLCVLDNRPRVLTADQSAALQALARQVMNQLELRKALAKERADERHRQLLVDELRHRIRNTLSVVQAIVSQSLRNTPDIMEARRSIDARLSAMANAHDLLTRTNWSAASIRQIVEVSFQPVAGLPGRITVDGPEIDMAPRAALALAMALHELSTNAAKYGALRQHDGTVSVRWQLGPTLEGEATPVELVWRERGGPAVAEPTRRGFGSQLITRILPATMGGTAKVDYLPDGLRWTLQTTLDAVNRDATLQS
ncbi:sensor histidine kinase [Glacieibacterium sp.]|uniref:sensor histidine kinase n=1 Tax=Glacieibacterium sp. TaxID=2860237 RepID=UPI003B00E8A4